MISFIKEGRFFSNPSPNSITPYPGIPHAKTADNLHIKGNCCWPFFLPVLAPDMSGSEFYIFFPNGCFYCQQVRRTSCIFNHLLVAGVCVSLGHAVSPLCSGLNGVNDELSLFCRWCEALCIELLGRGV